MKTTKFRALYEGKMHEVYRYNLSGEMVTIGLPRFPYTHEVVPDAVVQFTGLQDKNGKDIYEGDVYMIDECKIIVEIPDFFYNIESEMNSLEEKDIEIIGNIHENPELL